MDQARSMISPAAPSVGLVPAQWLQLQQAIAAVQAAGFGEVRIIFEHGHPRRLMTTVAAMLKTDDQAVAALQEFQVATAGLTGSFNVIVRNGHSTRVEVTTDEP